jgi:hypothetical protein
MLDLIIIKTAEHVLDAVNRPKGGFSITVDVGPYKAHYIYHNRPTRIKKFIGNDMFSNKLEYTTIEFPNPTWREMYIMGILGMVGLETSPFTIESKFIRDMTYL